MAKTALDLTPQEWQAYQPVQSLESRNAAQKLQQKKRQEVAWRLARQAAQLLRDKFRADKVVVFGSLNHQSWFNQWSDIDLAAWGIPPDRFYSAVAAITGLSPDFKIDLVDPESCQPALREVIEQTGLEL
jgi:predicted nucleotidyltransferase